MADSEWDVILIGAGQNNFALGTYLGKAGLLDGLSATTYYGLIDQLKEVAPKAHIVNDQRFVDNGRIILSAGISAGIDMSLSVVESLFGKGVADETAHYIEFRRS